MVRKKELIKEKAEEIDWHIKKYLEAEKEMEKLRKVQKESVKGIFLNLNRIQEIKDEKWE